MAGKPDIAASQAVDELNRQVAALALENARLSGELQQCTDDLQQSREYQAAVGEVLTAISRSTVDLAPVLQTLTDTALSLCEAEMGFICRRDGEAIIVVTAAGATPEIASDAEDYRRYQAARPYAIDRGSLAGRVALAGEPVQIPDIAADPEYTLAGATALGKIRTQVGVPLIREGALVGVLILSRQRVEPFSERQVGLLRTFADQAVIAMENARLLGELRESLDQQIATSEILQAINSSPSDLAPVFEAMLERAVQLSESAYGIMNVWEDGQYRAVALRGVPQGLMERWVAAPAPGPRNALSRIVSGEDMVHIEDLAAYESYHLGDERSRALVETGGARSLLAVALRKDGVLLGTLSAYRQEVRPFTDKQIALLQGFAQQAVIAMENARLINETREALERQTATTEVLEVINSSPGSLTPVFDTILAKATDLCEAEFGILWLYRDGFIRAAAHLNVPPSYAEFLGLGAHRVNPTNAHGRLLRGESVVHIPDIKADEAYVAGDPLRRALVELGGGRAQITVPLRKEGAFLGDFVIYRKEAGPFSDKQILLLQSFAAQAVIAIENARLFEELRDRQAELRVTLDNTGDGVVMFDAGLRLASWNRNFQEMLDIPDAFVAGRPGLDDYVGLLAGRGELGDGDTESTVADYRARATRQWSAERTRPDGRIIEVRNNPVPDGGAVLIYSDITERKRAEAAIAAARDAAEEALEQQTATAEILQAISQSPTDVQPVLDAVVKAAVRFCGATDAVIALREGDGAVFVAHEGPIIMTLGSSLPLNRESAGGRTMVDGRTCHLPDIASLDPVEFAAAHQFARAHGFRAALAAPLLRQNTAIGAVVLRKAEVGPYTPRQIELLETFAAQAVIAIENVRLFTELSDALEQQTATADILGVISRSPTDVQPVLEAVTRAALRFCGAPDAIVILRDGDEHFVAAHEGTLTTSLGLRRPIAGPNFFGQAMLEGRTRQIADVDALDATVPAWDLALARQHKWRASAAAPMMHGGKAIGCVVLRKPEPGLLSPRQIALLETFAAQAVIAIENVRLFTELSESLEQQTATAEVLAAINASPGDLAPVFETILQKAHALGGVAYGSLQLYDGQKFSAVAMHGIPEPLALRLRNGYVPGPNLRQLIEGAEVTHFPDIGLIDDPTARATVEGGIRTVLAVPLRKEGLLLGQIVCARMVVLPFVDKEIALLQSFAAQAVIAMENARLLSELRQSLEQQTATADVLKVIAGSPTDVQPVLDAVAKAAQRFCGGADAIISLREGDEFIRAAHEGSMPFVLGRSALNRSSVSGCAIVDGRTTHVPDIGGLDAEDFATSQALAVGSGARAALAAPMLREGVAIGSILLRKTNAGPFAPKQIELLEAFAAQAVIAIENVRLFTELKESLEQQTATAEILTVISQSPTDVGPVLSAVARAAMKFCGANDALVALRDGNQWVIAAHDGPIETIVGEWRTLTRHTAPGRAMTDGEIVRILDLQSAEGDEFPEGREIGARTGFRSALAAPLLRDEAPIGAISLRRREAGAFEPRQVDLLKTFAAQAVIAIENVRLFTELRETLEQQTATAEILRVIASSPADTRPAFEAIAKNANRLLGGLSTAVFRREGDWSHLAAFTPVNPEADEALKAVSPIRIANLEPALLPTSEGRIVQIPDTAAETLSAPFREVAAKRGNRSLLVVPLMAQGEPVGTVNVTRATAGAFDPDDVQLLQTFADQAVIAIQNARLLTELRETLEQQTATAEVLRVISQSPTDVKPVLEAVAAAARRFCNAHTAGVILRDGAEIFAAANDGPLDQVSGQRFPLNRGTVMGRSIVDGHSVYVPDMRVADLNEYPLGRSLSVELGHRSTMAAPLLSDGSAIGCILLRKPEPDGFTARQRELAETFAAQAVIAIQNVRLFTELRESLERLKAAQANLVQSEKMATLGQLTAGIAHEIKNPLNFVNNFAALSVELLDELKETAGDALATLDETKRAEVDETMDLLTGNLGKIAEHGKRADGIVRSMLSHSRGGSGDWAPSDINALVEEALNLAYHGARAQDSEFNVTLERDFARTPKPIDVVPQDVTRVFLNLFGNGFYAVGKRRKADKQAGFRPTLKVSTRDLGEAVEVRVRDNGTGIAPEVREKLFQPFFTTKPTGEGTGLGLSISYDVVTQQHGGTIEVESEPGRFTEFTVRLPRRRVQTSDRA